MNIEIETNPRSAARAFKPTLLLLVALSVTSCAGSEISPTAIRTPPPPPAGLRTIVLGQAVSGTISAMDSECRFITPDGGWGGLCNAFDLAVQSTGTLETTVRWSANAPLTIFVKTSAGAQIDMICCNPPLMTLQVPVEAGVSYRIEVAYTGRPSGYPNISPVTYVLGTRLLSAAESQSAAPFRVILFADETRTQRISFGRVEIADGPFEGSVAVFDSASGTYDIRGLPTGFAQIRASADKFGAATMKVPVGVSVAQVIALVRLVPLAGATHSLGGVTWGSANSAYEGVKLEILDGPHAGVFTFSWDNWGMYEFRSLSPGLIHVRASKEGLPSQTRAVVVSGATRLDFYF